MDSPSTAGVGWPLQPFASGFVIELQERGYVRPVIAARLRLMAELSSWLAARSLAPERLTPPLVREFFDAARASQRRKAWCSPTSERQLLAYLRGLGVVAPAELLVEDDPVGRLVGRFVAYLVRERGLRVGTCTVYEYERTARLFLDGRLDPDGGGLERLTTAEITGFVVAECRRRSVRMSRALVTSLRGLLRFLYLEGLTSGELASAVPSVAGWRGASLPRALDPEHVRRLLASCDRTTPVGRRDFAVLTVLSRLALRAGEVAALKLSDIDWRSGEVVIRGKGDRHERLPLPSDVGEALVDYLRSGRPRCRDPHLFLRARAPFGPLTANDSAIGMIVRRACRRAGLPAVGAHRLRHTAATEMLRAGAPLEEIASLLRHRDHATTVLYAKVDWVRLRELARPWPGSAP